MLTTNNSDHTETDWFDTVPAWASTGDTPAQHLADELISAGLVGPGEGQPEDFATSGDEWGWLGAPAVEPIPEPESVEPDVDSYREPEPESPAEPQAPAEVFVAPIASTPPPPRRSRPQASRRAVIAAVAVVVLFSTAGIALLFNIFGGATHSAGTRDPVEALGGGAAASAPPVVADECPEGVEGPVTVGNDAGDQRSGPGVIKAFDHAYYVERSGAAARAVATPNGVGTTQALQASIDAIPADTRHCLTITDRGNGLFAVQLTQTPPDGGQPTVYRQLIQTVQAGGKTWISSIRKDTT